MTRKQIRQRWEKFTEIRTDTVLFFQLLAMLELGNRAVTVRTIGQYENIVNFDDFIISAYMKRQGLDLLKL